ncbi:MAG: SufD family Fe-S cluster assembly protein [Clostridia bacterium]|nr:SufD family Fe-S cluster assembly protein [Clostridia bacterium]
MKDLVINESSTRTARNYLINNIKLSDIKIPKIKEFKNIKVISESGKDVISEDVSKDKLTYGIDEAFTNEVLENANHKLKINVNSKTNKNIYIRYKFDENNQTLVDNIDIESEEGCRETINIVLESEGNREYYHNGIIRVNAKENTDIKVNIISLININSLNFISIENTLCDFAKVSYTYVEFGGRNSITNYYSNVIGKEAISNIDTVFLGKENQLFDANYLTDLRGVKSETNMIIEGALSDTSKNHFKGIIDFKKGCKKAKGNEQESCTLLSDKSKSIAMPVLLCSEEDVEGSHGNSAGKVGEKELFYIMSRGLTKKEAMRLLVKAKFNKILEKIHDDEYTCKINSLIDERLGE